MPDINLLKDTKRDEEPKKKAPDGSFEPELTSPPKVTPIPSEPKLPSRFSLWLKSLRQTKPDPTEPAKVAPLPAPPKPKVNVKLPAIEPTPPQPEDIFEQLDTPKADLTPPTPYLPTIQREPKKMDMPAPAPMVNYAPGVQSVPRPGPRPEPPAAPPNPPKKGKPAVKTNDHGKGDYSLVNLLPSEFQQSVDPRSKLVSLGITVAASAVLVVGVFALLTLYRTSIFVKIQTLRDERNLVEQEITAQKPRQREAIATRTRLQLVSDLLDQHIYWTKFFDKLEQYTIDDVYYPSAFIGTLGGQITLTAVGTSFEAPARQLVVLQNAKDFVSTVSINSATASDKEGAIAEPGKTTPRQVTFSITLQLVPEIFSYTSADFPAERAAPVAPGASDLSGPSTPSSNPTNQNANTGSISLPSNTNSANANSSANRNLNASGNANSNTPLTPLLP